jgi:hypothetical protein
VALKADDGRMVQGAQSIEQATTYGHTLQPPAECNRVCHQIIRDLGAPDLRDGLANLVGQFMRRPDYSTRFTVTG